MKIDNFNLINYNKYVSQRNKKLHKKHVNETNHPNTTPAQTTGIVQSSGLPSFEFIAGLLTGIGAFLWVKQKNSEVPVFQLKMQAGDHELLKLIKDKLGIKESIHKYIHQRREYSLLLIRSRRTIENTLIPIFDGRLFGQKATQFELWKKKYYEKKLEFVYKKHS